MANTAYRKLSGRSLLSAQGAYLGEDHLLVLDGQYRETYRKLFYKDIQAILICPTVASKVSGMIFLLLALISLLVALSNIGNGSVWPGIIFMAIFVASAGLIIHGKGSVVFGLQTNVQTLVLHGINTRRKADRAQRLIAEQVEQVQGELTVEALRAAISQERVARQDPPVLRAATAAVRPPTIKAPPLPSQTKETGSV